MARLARAIFRGTDWHGIPISSKKPGPVGKALVDRFTLDAARRSGTAAYQPATLIYTALQRKNAPINSLCGGGKAGPAAIFQLCGSR
jgi:hypothetical protein